MHAVMAVIMVILTILCLAGAAWLLTALALADPDAVELRRQRQARRELGRAAERCRQ